ncbi:MAG: FG-GAP repeat protein [Chloroflexi bacterium]|uniref:hypothetical protein n=1 Tax=Candidatus Flexifilum breve TaxID=3140694 RepID=UPI003136ADA5|nr:FG-GAP repeat protein [Chloroflexota bacterium]
MILLFDPPADLRVRFLIGGEDNDMMPYALAVGDVDGDGVVDIAPNAMSSDGPRNEVLNAGEAPVVSGAEFLSAELVFQSGSGSCPGDRDRRQRDDTPRGCDSGGAAG